MRMRCGEKYTLGTGILTRTSCACPASKFSPSADPDPEPRESTPSTPSSPPPGVWVPPSPSCETPRLNRVKQPLGVGDVGDPDTSLRRERSLLRRVLASDVSRQSKWGKSSGGWRKAQRPFGRRRAVHSGVALQRVKDTERQRHDAASVGKRLQTYAPLPRQPHLHKDRVSAYVERRW